MPPCDSCGERHTIYADEMDCRDKVATELTLDRWSRSWDNIDEALIADRLKKYVGGR